jgi:hypothetical protein
VSCPHPYAVDISIYWIPFSFVRHMSHVMEAMIVVNEVSRVVHAWLNRMPCELLSVWLRISCLPQSLFQVLLPTLPMYCITPTFCSVRRSRFVFCFLLSLLQCACCPIFLRTCQYCFFLVLVLQREISVSAICAKPFLNPSVSFARSCSCNPTV